MHFGNVHPWSCLVTTLKCLIVFVIIVYFCEGRQVKARLCGIQELVIETPCFSEPRCGADSPGFHISSLCPKNDLNPDIEREAM